MAEPIQQPPGPSVKQPPLHRGADPALYEICLACRLADRWVERFHGMKVSYDDHGNTCLLGSFDQAALHGVFNTIRDLNLVLISVQRK